MEKNLENFYSYLVDEKGKDPTTANKYIQHVRNAINIGPLKRLRDDSLAPNTKHLIKAALVSYYDYTDDQETLKKIKNFQLPPVGRVQEKRPFTKQEWEQLRNVIKEVDFLNNNMRCVLSLIAIRGFRVGDILRIRKEDVDNALLSGELMFKAKRSKRLTYGVMPAMRPYLQSLSENKKWETIADLISPRAESYRRHDSAIVAVERAVKLLAAFCDMDPTKAYPHRFRRTVATYALEKMGGDLTKLKAWMGWSSINTAAGYSDYYDRQELDEMVKDLF